MSSLVSRLARCLTLPLAASLALNGCGHEPVRRVPEPGPVSEAPAPVPQARKLSAGQQAAVAAVRQIGVPYVYGGNSVRGFDCSGLVQYAWSKAGRKIPRTTNEQWQRLTPVDSNNLRVGDLLFFRINGRIAHVGLYLGDRRFVHAPESGREVTVATLDSDFYRRAFVRGARPH